jgi:flagellar FliL protein
MAPDHPEFPPALGVQLSTWVNDGIEHASLELHPQDLGPIEIHIAVKDGQTQVELGSAVPGTREALNLALPQLGPAGRRGPEPGRGPGLRPGQPFLRLARRAGRRPLRRPGRRGSSALGGVADAGSRRQPAGGAPAGPGRLLRLTPGPRRRPLRHRRVPKGPLFMASARAPAPNNLFIRGPLRPSPKEAAGPGQTTRSRHVLCRRARCRSTGPQGQEETDHHRARARPAAGAGRGAAFFLLKKKSADGEEGDGSEDAAQVEKKPKREHKKEDPKHPPVFVALDPFVVNLTDRDTDRYAQIGITLQVEDEKASEEIKAYLPAIRNNILLLLSHKSSEELMAEGGKEKLAQQILREAALPMGIELEDPDEAKRRRRRARRRSAAATTRSTTRRSRPCSSPASSSSDMGLSPAALAPGRR